MVDVLLGLQWGDEGKGKIADYLTPNYDVVARFQGGPNAGHSLEFNGIKHVLNTIPSGIFHSECTNLIGGGVVVDPILLRKEIEKLQELNVDVAQNLFIAKRTHLILPTHRLLDAASEASMGKAKIGSTLKGISPAYQDKTGRSGLRFGDVAASNFKERYEQTKRKHLELLKFFNYQYDQLDSLEKDWFDALDFLKSIRQVDGEYFINQYISKGKKVLAEGAQGTLLDVDFGSYPYVTSSNTVTAGACVGLGISPKQINNVFGIFKAYCTRVGSGPFPTELHDNWGDELRAKGHEFGATTGRPRRCGWIDLPALKYAIMLNGVTSLIMTKADVLTGFSEVNVCTSYQAGDSASEQLPFDLTDEQIKPQFIGMPGWEDDISMVRSVDHLSNSFRNYVTYLEARLGCDIDIISVGPDREQTIIRNQISEPV